eukprot:scaffold46387_cov52-Attheya_sp.AAC.1
MTCPSRKDRVAKAPRCPTTDNDILGSILSKQIPCSSNHSSDRTTFGTECRAEPVRCTFSRSLTSVGRAMTSPSSC